MNTFPMTDLGGRLLVSRKSYPPNTVLCREGEPSESIYLLLRGSIQSPIRERSVRLSICWTSPSACSGDM